jgi:L-ascorbate metabolism protein UlaG (beta-lactamase superfamily)
MEITFLGRSCIRLRGRDTQVVIDPDPSARITGDIVVHTEGSTDASKLRVTEGAAQEVRGPGEYELRGVLIRGMPAQGRTIMKVEVDDVTVVALGRFSGQLTEEQIDALGHVDVLVVPVGGGGVLSATEATKLVRAVEPAIVVPLAYETEGGDSGGQEPVARFASEMGLAEGWVPQPKLNLTGSAGAVEETRVVVLEARG